MRPYLMFAALLAVTGSAAGLFLQGNEPTVEEVVTEVGTARAGLATATTEFGTSRAGLASGVSELGTARAGLAASIPELGTARAGLAAVIIELYIPPNLPPVAVCQDATVPLDEFGVATVDPALVDGGSFDPDGDPITLAVDPTTFGCSDVGDQYVTLTVTDTLNAQDTCMASVSVVDATAPVVALFAYPDHMWPPNHRMVDIMLGVSVSDNFAVGGAVITTMTVESNEADDAQGGGDGRTTGDIVVLDSEGDLKVDSSSSGSSNSFVSFTYEEGDQLALRAERRGNGDGREYTITLTASDGSGNETPVTFVVRVPHDQSAHAAFCEDPECSDQ